MIEMYDSHKNALFSYLILQGKRYFICTILAVKYCFLPKKQAKYTM